MKLKTNTKLFLGLGTALLACSPLTTVVSCSSSNPPFDLSPNISLNDYWNEKISLPNISKELNDKMNSLWVSNPLKESYKLSKLGTSLIDKLKFPELIAKTKNDVQTIADQKFQKLNQDNLKEYLINIFNINSYINNAKTTNKNGTHDTKQRVLNDVKNLKFNKEKSEMSFNLISTVFHKIDITVGNKNTTYSVVVSIDQKISNFKIESYVREIILKDKTILIPSIRNSLAQPNASFQLVKCEILGDEEEHKKLLDLEYDFIEFPENKPKPTKEEYISYILNDHATSIRAQKAQFEPIRELGIKLGQVNGVFTINEEFDKFKNENINDLTYNDLHRFNIFKNFGCEPIENESNSNNVVPSALKILSPIFYSTINNKNEVDWEIYNLI